ncbi:MAG TPA: hypothetical protein P5186_29385 [Candidatus Paceibacterota bacterium]|nr:hypothetical protein [Verrucomicrobiota bacterium]HRY52161.1 hypothetical protein [Candidatus Paceibacterota bacterium]
MNCKTLPDTIRTIIAQAWGHSLRSAFIYVGTYDYSYRCAELHGEYRSGRPSRLVTGQAGGYVDYEVGLQCQVNGKRGKAWTLIIAYEPDDTYTVWLIEGHRERSAESMVLARVEDVYCDTLQSVIESVYDRAIQEHNDGFIPLS